jgi:hypothetical protein
MSGSIYDATREQLYRLFGLVNLIRLHMNLMDDVLGEDINKKVEGNLFVDYDAIGRRLVELTIKREATNLSEVDLPLIMLSSVSDAIMSTVELEHDSKVEFFDDNGGLVNVNDKLEEIFFCENEEIDEKVNDFIEFHINRLMYRGINEFTRHDFNIEDWLVLGENKIGLYLDNSVYHHYGCWIPKKFLDHLSMPLDFSNSEETKLQLFFKRKAYQGTLIYEGDTLMLYWDNLLRRRINKKYPQVFSYEEDFKPTQKVLMSFFYHDNFDDNFLKIDFELIDM